MASRPIVEFPHPVLKQRCQEVARFDGALWSLLDDMKETMADADGLGLAANQVAVSWRVFTMLVPVPHANGDGRDNDSGKDNDKDKDGAPPEVLELVNPVVVGKRGEIRFEEGCLSFPGVHEQVLRAAEVDVTFQDRHGAAQRRSFGGVAAVCVQHELDHLDGVTFLERLSPLKRRLALRSYQRAQLSRQLEAEDDRRAAARAR